MPIPVSSPPPFLPAESREADNPSTGVSRIAKLIELPKLAEKNSLSQVLGIHDIPCRLETNASHQSRISVVQMTKCFAISAPNTFDEFFITLGHAVSFRHEPWPGTFSPGSQLIRRQVLQHQIKQFLFRRGIQHIIWSERSRSSQG